MKIRNLIPLLLCVLLANAALGVQQITNVFNGTTPGDGTGDKAYVAFRKLNTNDNFLQAEIVALNAATGSFLIATSPLNGTNVIGTITNSTTGNAATATTAAALSGTINESQVNSLVGDLAGKLTPSSALNGTNLVGTLTNNTTGNAATATSAGSLSGSVPESQVTGLVSDLASKLANTWAAVKGALGFDPQCGTAYLTNWSTINPSTYTAPSASSIAWVNITGTPNLATNTPAGIFAALGYWPQQGTLTLSNWSALATSAKQDTLGYIPATNTFAGIVAALGYTPVTNSFAGVTNALGYQPATNGVSGGGGVTNAVATISSNGVSIATGVTNLDFWPGSGVTLSFTNRAGHVDVFISGSGGGSAVAAGDVSITVATNTGLYTITAPWLSTTRHVTGAMADGNSGTPNRFGDLATALGSAIAIAASATAPAHILFNTTASSGNGNGIFGTGLWNNGNNEFNAYIALTNVVNHRTWIGIVTVPNSSSWGTDDLPETSGRQGAAFRGSTAAGDSNFKCIVSNGSASTVVDSGLPISAEVWTRFGIKYIGTAAVSFYTNGVLVTTISDSHVPQTVPAADQVLIRTTTLEGAVKGVRWGQHWHIADK